MSAELKLLPDAELWPRVCRGDTAAFAAVVERFQAPVSAVAYGICGNLAHSEDLAQETFLAAWRQPQALDEPLRLGAWLCGIARNLARNAVRRAPRDRQHDEPAVALAAASDDPAAAAVTREEENLVWQALEELPQPYRETLILYYRDEHGLARIAAALDLSEDAVKQRLARGRAMLREQVAAVVEGALTRSKPGRRFTLAVLAAAGIVPAASQASLAATIGGALPPLAAVAGKGALAGAAGGLLGGGLGLFGGWLGYAVPARLAPTQRQRDYIQRTGRRTLLGTLPFMLVLGLFAWYGPGRLGVPQYLLAMLSWFAALGIYVGLTTWAMARGLRRIQQETAMNDEPNPSAVPERLQQVARRWVGRRYTSAATLAGWPLVDIQLSDPGGPRWQKSHAESGARGAGTAAQRRRARGWIAIGDDALGLIAIGGRARGLVALGGIAVGVFCLGGLSFGLCAFGGLAIGLLALGGLGIGGFAVGGLAFGWEAVGGLAVAWNVAAGGGALAWHAAFGGGAWARDLAQGGAAVAEHANDAVAKEFFAAHWTGRLIQAWSRHTLAVTLVTVVVALVPSLLMPLFYRRANPGGPTV